MADVLTEPVDGEEEVEKPDPRLSMPDLYNACKSNDTNVALQYLYEEVPPTYIDKNNGFTCLHWAAMHGNVTLTQKLLECGASEPYHRRTRLAKAAAIRKQNAKNATTTPAAENIENSSSNGEDSEQNIEEKVAVPDKDEEEEEEGLEEDRALEKKFNILQNTPLLWATMKGHLGVVWCLLVNHYSSSNDVDDLGNNMLHIAAAAGFHKILKVGIEDGGNIYARNIYHNYPIHLANTKEIYDLLSETRDATPVPLTEAEILEKHEANVARYTNMLNELVNATAEAAKIDSPRGAGLLIAGSGSSNDTITVLGNAIDDAKEWALNSELIEQAEKLCDRLELSQDLRNEIATLQAEMPIVTQTDYVQFVLPVERLLEELDRVGQLGAAGGGGGMDRPLQQLGKDIVLRCQIEFWISTLVARLKDVVCATDAHEHDMKKLKAAIQKGQALRASEEVVDNAMVFLKRLDGELILSRAIVSVPTVKLPVEDPEPGYYEDGVDTGRIRETEEYPLPPVDTGTYIWECSSSYTSLLEAIEALKKGLQMADGTGANEDVIANAKAKLNKAEKDMKLLDAKDQADKQAAIDIATKAAKKLKKKKKG